MTEKRIYIQEMKKLKNEQFEGFIHRLVKNADFFGSGNKNRVYEKTMREISEYDICNDELSDDELFSAAGGTYINEVIRDDDQ